MPGGFEIGSAFVNVTLRTGGAVAQLAALTAAAGAAGAALAAVPAAGASLAGIGGVLAGSFSGVGDALKAYGKDQDNASKAGRTAAKQAVQNARQIKDAQESIDDARQNAAKVARDSARSISDAEQNVRDAAEQSAEAIADAKDRQAEAAENGAERISSAEERVQDAQRNAVRVQEDLTRAREDAQRQIEDLREATEDFALDEEGAALRVAKAEERLREVQVDHHASTVERAQALHDLKVAQDEQADQLRDHKRATDDLTKAEAKGVEGSDKVVDAKERVTDAEESVADAQKDQQKAVADAAKANQKAAKDVSDAVKDGAKRQQTAEENLADAREQAAESSADAADRVSDAVENLAEVQSDQAAAAEEAAHATNTYQDALAKLLPSQRDLVEQLISMKPLVDRLNKASADAFLPGLTQMLKDSEGLFPIFEGFLRDTGTIMGDTARDMGTLFKSEEFKKDLKALLDNSLPVTQAIGDMFVGMTKALVSFGGDMDDTSIGFASFIKGFSDGITGFLENLKPYDENFRSIWESLGRIVKVFLPAVGTALGKLAEIVDPIFKKIADFMENHKDELDEWLLAILGFYVALKGFGVVAGVSRMVGGVITAWGRLPAGMRTAMLGVAAAVAGIGLADMLLPPADPDWASKDPLSSTRAYLENQRDDIHELWAGIMDPGAALADLQTELDEFPANFAKSPFMDFFGNILPKWWNGLWGPDGEITRPFYEFGDRLQEAGTHIAEGFKNGLWEGMKALGYEIGSLFTDYVITPIKNLFGIHSPSTVFYGFGIDIIAGFVSGFGGIAQAAWNILKSLWDTVTNWFGVIGTTVWNGAKTSFDNFVLWISQLPQTAWNWLKSTWDTVSDWMDNLGTTVWNGAKRIVDNFVNWVSTLPQQAWDWFNRAATNVGLAWDQLREKAAAPVRFVIDSVINKGVIGAWNWLVGKVGLGDPVPLVPMPFATGGAVFGAGTATSDSIPALLSNGEHVLTAKEVQGLGGHGAVEQIRSMARSRKALYALGGPVSPGEMFGVLKGVFPGIRLTSGFRPGDPGYHGQNKAGDFGAARPGDAAGLMAIDQWIARNFPRSTELIYTPGTSLRNGAPFRYSDRVRADHYDHVHWANRGSLGTGTAGASGNLGSASGVVSSIWDEVGGFFQSQLNSALGGLAGMPGAGEFGAMIGGFPKKITDAMYSKARDTVTSMFDFGGGNGPEGTGPVVDQVRAVAARYGWGDGPQWAALSWLISHESGWRPNAQNPTSTAFGLFQFLNSTWGSVGASKTSNPGQQAEAGLKYISSRYHDPAGAQRFWQGHHWYEQGGILPPGATMAMNGTGQNEYVLTRDQLAGVGSGVTINGNITVVANNPKEFVEQMRQEARRGKKGRSA